MASHKLTDIIADIVLTHTQASNRASFCHKQNKDLILL